VLVDVEVAGVNYGDTMIRRGEYLRDQPLSMAPGCEVVRRVAMAAGGSVEPDTRVAGWIEAGGGYADRVIALAHRVYSVPDDISGWAIAASFLKGTTADYALHRYGRMQPGETVYSCTARREGVGGLAVQLAKLAGGRVIATASSDDKREIAREQGADFTLDSRDPGRLAEGMLGGHRRARL
jgi:NADPH2:quinone reductase